MAKRLIFVKTKFHAGDLSVTAEMKDLESTLSALVSKEAQGAIIHSRAQWLEEGEKPTRYIFRLENSRAEKTPSRLLSIVRAQNKPPNLCLPRMF